MTNKEKLTVKLATFAIILGIMAACLWGINVYITAAGASAGQRDRFGTGRENGLWNRGMSGMRMQDKRKRRSQ